MKKNLLFIGALALSMHLSAQMTIVNGDLEMWDAMGTAPNNYDEPSGGFLSTLNELVTLGVPITVQKVTDAHAGSFAAKMTSKQTSLLGSLFVPGVMGTIKAVTLPPSAILGKPFTDKPSAVTGWYKYTSVQGDSAEIFAYQVKRNGAVRDTIAKASYKIYQSASTYTQFQADFIPVAANQGMTPDSMILVCTSSAGYNFSDLLACAGKDGSALWIDDINVTYAGGVDEYNSNMLNVFPNPVTDILNITSTTDVQNASLKVFNMNGQIVVSQTISGNKFNVDLSGFPSGTYFLRIDSKNGILASKQIEKK